MKAITILQPYAELIALELKHYETRSWPTNYKGKIAIHAGKELYPITPEIKQAVEASVFYSGPFHPTYIEDWTRGAVIAIADLVDCLKIDTADTYQGNMILLYNSKGLLISQFYSSDNEITFGDYSKGRYAWKLENVEMLKVPIPAKGQQGLWNFNYDDTEK